MVGPASLRRAVHHVVDNGMGKTAQACRALELARSSFYQKTMISEESQRKRRVIIATSERHPRYGYRRVTAVLKREGLGVGKTRVQRIRREEGMQVRKKQRKTRRYLASEAVRQRAEYRNHVWSWDFVHDQTDHGSRFRILSLIDEHTRECLALIPRWSMGAQDVIRHVATAMKNYGCPEFIRSDNGPEFIAYAVQDWLKENQIKAAYIRPGSPWEQAHIESFHDKLRDELLNRELFTSLREAEVLLEEWRKEYNEFRPHSSLGNMTPFEFRTTCGCPPLQPPAVAPDIHNKQKQHPTESLDLRCP
jgi:transposase InsO family protein